MNEIVPMKVLILLSLLSLALASEVDDLEQKKRGAAKSPVLNSISSNSHQKPEQFTYVYQQGPIHQPAPPTNASPVYSAPNQHTAAFYSNIQPSINSNHIYPLNQQEVLHQNYQPQGHISFLQPPPNFIPIQYIPQPRYQILPKVQNGQLSFLSQTPFAAAPPNLHLSPNLYPNVFPTQASTQPSSATTPSGGNSQTYASQAAHGGGGTSANPYALTPTAYINHPANSFGYGHHPLIGQPSTMFIFSQPAPQLYNNYLPQPSNLLYSNAAQQLLNYYQSNPQAKYQLLYGNSGQTPSSHPNYNTNSNHNGYQASPPTSDYDKPLPGPVSQSLSKIDNDLNTNEYITPSESNSYKAVNAYNSRAYKT